MYALQVAGLMFDTPALQGVMQSEGDLGSRTLGVSLRPGVSFIGMRASIIRGPVSHERKRASSPTGNDSHISGPAQRQDEGVSTTCSG